ncbi:Protein-tyrosine sulfotransferase 2 [Saguinus oedipus]|uniref:Protein-tyrosine sulfotransferase n=1 Tax=Saguinus oedipus TaxID=9490 RepID=A0ABQ9WI03_SAGOE|nr:Protein-tyrosine sulfotransferase 2 [Saguinus oedipus]
MSKWRERFGQEMTVWETSAFGEYPGASPGVPISPALQGGEMAAETSLYTNFQALKIHSEQGPFLTLGEDCTRTKSQQERDLGYQESASSWLSPLQTPASLSLTLASTLAAACTALRAPNISQKGNQSHLLCTKSCCTEVLAKLLHQPQESHWRPVGLLHWESSGLALPGDSLGTQAQGLEPRDESAQRRSSISEPTQDTGRRLLPGLLMSILTPQGLSAECEPGRLPANLSLKPQKRAPRLGLRRPWPSMRLSVRRVLLAAGCTLALVLAVQLGQQVLECQAVLAGLRSPRRAMRPEQEELVMVGTNHVEYRYGKAMPLIFVGGVPRSGTTLMRAMLDAHPEVRCGEETRIIPRVLAMRQAWSKSGREKLRLDEAGVTDEVLDAAMQAFILEVIAKHGEPARVLCNKDPFTLKSSVYLSRLFPNSKFLLMVRDGRASVHSMITRKVTIAGFDLSSYRDCLTKWNKAIEVMYAQCMEVGKDKCLPVYYEQLVLHPKRSLKLILDFLGIAWSDAVLHHEDLIGKPGGVSLSKIERSTDQVIKPVNLEALSKWTGHIPGDVLRDMAQIAPMLARLGYDPYANPPNYGNPDPIVINNTHRVSVHLHLWKYAPGDSGPLQLWKLQPPEEMSSLSVPGHVLKGDYKTPANLKGYFQVNQNSTSSHLGSS